MSFDNDFFSMTRILFSKSTKYVSKKLSHLNLDKLIFFLQNKLITKDNVLFTLQLCSNVKFHCDVEPGHVPELVR